MNVIFGSVALVALFHLNAQAGQQCPASSLVPGGRPEVQTIDYEGISLIELVDVYRNAYVKSGFKFKEQTMLSDGRAVRLSLTLAIPGQPKKKEANGVLVFHSVLGADNCRPCEVHREIMGVRYEFYKGEELVGVQNIVYAADEAANRRIKKKLGLSLYDIVPDRGTAGPC
jgi:hypothetical protein